MRKIGIAAICILLIIFFMYPIFFYRLGNGMNYSDTVSSLIELPIKHSGLSSIQIILYKEAEYNPDYINISVNGRAQKMFWVRGNSTLGEIEFVSKINSDSSNGIVAINSPFKIRARLLYQPVWNERAKILFHRLTVWRPIFYYLLLPFALAGFLLSGTILVLSDLS